MNAKGIINNWKQMYRRDVVYELVKESGPDHEKIFTVDLLLDCQTIATGTGTTKKEAQRQASMIAVNKLELSSGFTSHNQIQDDSKSKLNELLQAKRMSCYYDAFDKQGPDHDPTFSVQLFINKMLVALGRAGRKKKAEQHAAGCALKRIEDGTLRLNDTEENFPRFPHTGMSLYDELATIAHRTFESVTHNAIFSIGNKTVIAAIIMENCHSGFKTVLSIGSGNVFINEEYMSQTGETVIDSHAEIIARRGFKRVLFTEVDKMQRKMPSRLGILQEGENGKLSLVDGICFHLYISKAPCGDGSLFSQSQTGSHSESGNIHSPIISNKKQGQLRAKLAKGEALIPVDEFPDDRFHKMSCSDKICKWNVLGLQGALLSCFIENPLYLSSVVIGDVYNFNHLSRALCCRVKTQGSKFADDNNLTVKHPDIGISKIYEKPELGKSKSVSVNWNIGDDFVEVTNGRTGLIWPEKYLSFIGNQEYSSRLCKKELYRSYQNVDNFRQQKMINSLYNRGQSLTYNDAKMLARQYQDSKERLFNVFRKKGYGSWKRHYNVNMFS